MLANHFFLYFNQKCKQMVPDVTGVTRPLRLEESSDLLLRKHHDLNDTVSWI